MIKYNSLVWVAVLHFTTICFNFAISVSSLILNISYYLCLAISSCCSVNVTKSRLHFFFLVWQCVLCYFFNLHFFMLMVNLCPILFQIFKARRWQYRRDGPNEVSGGENIIQELNHGSYIVIWWLVLVGILWPLSGCLYISQFSSTYFYISLSSQ